MADEIKKLKKPMIKNPELKAAVAEWKENRTDFNEEKMLEALKNAKFIAPVIIDEFVEKKDSTDDDKQEAKARFILVKDKNGTNYFPAFTEWLEVLKWNNDPDTQPIVVTFDNYAALLIKQNPDARGIVIDPNGMNLMVPTPIFMKAKGIDLPTPNATPGAPATSGRKKVNMDVKDFPEYPEELLEKFRNHLDLVDGIHAAFILGMVNREDASMKSFFLILDIAPMPDDARKVIFDQLGKIARPYCSAPIGLMPLNSPIGKQISKNHTPFYIEEGYTLPDFSQEENDNNGEPANNA